MKPYISIAKIIAYFLVVLIAAFACTHREPTNKTSETIAPSAILPVKDPHGTTQLSAAELPKDQVCMVNNAFMGKKQIPVAYDNKTYYGCCEMCVAKIKNDKSARYATDPGTGKQVDKASAFIVLNPASKDGSVLYFESEQSFNTYQAGALFH
jgi:hypothetical protein